MDNKIMRSNIEAMLYSYLRLEKRVIGVKLYHDKAEFESLEIRQLSTASYYCQMVKMGVNGKLIKAGPDNFACDTSAKLLGIEPFYEEDEGIRGWFDSGLYADYPAAARQHQTVRPVADMTAGIVVGPLTKLPEDPDVVIIVCKPYQAMRLIQAYTYHEGFKKDFKMSGMCGVCFESTALPLTDQEFTVSLLCSGTRYVCKWPEELMMVSFPFAMAERLLDGLVETADPCEPDNLKHEIVHRLRRHGLSPGNKLHRGKGYFYKDNG